jgi:DNA-binding NarL/FixJ family response regulator
MVVEGHPMVRRACAVVLAPVAEVVAVPCAADALERLGSGARVDLVLLQLGVPYLEGLPILDALLAAEPSLAARVVVLSDCMHVGEARALQARGVRCLCRPVGADVLRAVVADLGERSDAA